MKEANAGLMSRREADKLKPLLNILKDNKDINTCKMKVLQMKNLSN